MKQLQMKAMQSLPYRSKEAINRMRIELTQVYAPPLPAEKLPAPKKKGFLARFFGGNK